MYLDNKRISSTCREPGRSNEQAFDLVTVTVLPADHLGLSKGGVLQFGIEMRSAYRVCSSTRAKKPDIWCATGTLPDAGNALAVR